jgi:hypothetical protein
VRMLLLLRLSGSIIDETVTPPTATESFFYKSMTLLPAYKPDLLVEKAVIVELKTVEKILPVHEAQMLTYLRLSGLERGLLLNFNSVPLKAGIRRLNKSNSSPVSPVSPLSPCPSRSQDS